MSEGDRVITTVAPDAYKDVKVTGMMAEPCLTISESEAVGVIIGFECSAPPLRKSPPPSGKTAPPIPPPTLMPVYDTETGRWDTDNLIDVLAWEARNDFEFSGWSYEQNLPETCVCKRCGNDRFLVGYSDAMLTILKCPNCGWERVVHDG